MLGVLNDLLLQISVLMTTVVGWESQSMVRTAICGDHRGYLEMLSIIIVDITI